ncbi:MAG TPA: flagellar biosynthetic protein FliR [Bacilli bacterium]
MQLITSFLPAFLLVFCRITSFFVVVPVFSIRGVPLPFRVGLSFFVSLLVFTAIGTTAPMEFDSLFLLNMAREITVGLLLGFTAYLFFTLVQIAGSFMDMQIGFGIVNVIDPATGAQSPVFGNFAFMLAMLFFLSINGHHYLLEAIMDSYKWVPLSNEIYANIQNGAVSTFLLDSFATVFYLAFQIAAPILAAMFLVDLALGVLAKTAPQFNIFVVGFQVKIAVGLIMVMLLVSSFLYVFQQLFATMFEALMNLLKILHL